MQQTVGWVLWPKSPPKVTTAIVRCCAPLRQMLLLLPFPMRGLLLAGSSSTLHN